MAEVIPFKGILYNPDIVSGDAVIAPPYDVISPEYKERLYQQSASNIVRIDFGKEMPDDTDSRNKYTRAQEYFDQWLREDILVRDDADSFYGYEIDYIVNGESKKLRGVLALVKIEELGSGIYPHEATHSKPKSDRLNLMRSCMANISPIYALYDSPERATSGILESVSGKPYFTAHDQDGAEHKLYKIQGPSQIDLIKRELSDKSIFIADGHHRYEVAVEFKKEMDKLHGREPGTSGQKPWDYVLMFLANIVDEGITILPTHRIVKGISKKDMIISWLEPHFEILFLDRNEMTADIISTIGKKGKNTFGLYLAGEDRWCLMKYKGAGLNDLHPVLRDLDVVLLHELALKKDLGITEVVYEMDANVAVTKARAEGFDAVFFLNPTGVKDVEAVALSDLRMPPKSTYFYPKLLTGMVINSFKNQF